MSATLDKLARSLTSGAEPFAFCGIGLGDPDEFYTATADGITANEDSYWRAASISKIVTGRAAFDALSTAGAVDATVESILGIPFRSPDGTPPKVAHLASH